MNQNLMADVEGRPSDGVMEKKGRGGGGGCDPENFCRISTSYAKKKIKRA